MTVAALDILKKARPARSALRRRAGDLLEAELQVHRRRSAACNCSTLVALAIGAVIRRLRHRPGERIVASGRRSPPQSRRAPQGRACPLPSRYSTLRIAARAFAEVFLASVLAGQEAVGEAVEGKDRRGRCGGRVPQRHLRAARARPDCTRSAARKAASCRAPRPSSSPRRPDRRELRQADGANLAAAHQPLDRARGCRRAAPPDRPGADNRGRCIDPEPLQRRVAGRLTIGRGARPSP